MKSQNKAFFTLLMIFFMVAAQSCKYFSKSDYTTLSATDLTALVDTLPDMQKRMLAQNEAQRKQLVTTFKQAFALAQAAEAEGLQKTDKFKRGMELSKEQLLAAEFNKRNPGATVTKEETDAFFAAHQADFEADLKMVNEGRKQEPTEEQREALKSQWSEMRALGEKGRQAGLEKDPGFAVQLKFSRANRLANLYSQSLEDRLKLTPEEKAKYIAEHPEADLDKLKQKAQGLLDRVKQGESFEKIADEFNEDGTKGRGGDLDWFSRGKMDPDFEKAAFSLEKGQTSPELIKSGFGFHIVRVDDKRKVAPPAPAPAAPHSPPPPPPSKEPKEEVRARHIYVSTSEAEGFEQKLIQDKVKRAMEDTSLKFSVAAPADFTVNVAGLSPGRVPGLGGGQGGQMKGINPNENK